MDQIFKFIKDRFLLMPQWVQVTTYLSFVVLFIYLFTAPRFLDMRLVSNDYGDEFPIGGAQIEIEIEGRVLILLTDSRGRFSVPISTNYPLGSYLFILSPDSSSNKIKEIKVPVSNSYLNRSKIIYSKKTNDYKIIPNGVIENTQKLFAEINLISTAYADNHKPVLKEEIEKEILKALEVITEIPFKQIPRNVALRDDLELDNIDLSYINSRLNRKYNIDCLRDFQRRAKTIEDLIRIARSTYYKNNNIQPENSSLRITQPTKQKDLSSDILAKYKRGRILRKSNSYASAIKYLKQVVDKKPKFYRAWFNLALAYEGLGESEKAETAFKTTLKLKKNDAKIYNAYGMFLFKQQRYDEAAEQFKKEKRLKNKL